MNTEPLRAAIPPQPDDLRVVMDRDGDVWQKVKPDELTSNDPEAWRCVRPKMHGMFGGGANASWKTMVVNFGPVYPLYSAET